MKILFSAIALTLFAGNLLAGDIGSMMKDKARGLGGQPAPQQPTPPPPGALPSAAPQQLTPEQRALVAVVADLDKVTPERGDKLGVDLLTMVRGANKPSSATVQKLGKDLAAALAGKTVTPMQRSRLGQNLQAILGDAKLSDVQLAAVVADVPALLKKAGAESDAIAAVEADLKAVLVGIGRKSVK